MKRMKLILVGALAAASIGVAAPPAWACPPDGPCPCTDNAVNRLYRKLTGEDLFHCPWA